MKSCLFSAALACVVFPLCSSAQTVTFSDVSSKAPEKAAITKAISSGWMLPVTTSTFGYGAPISPDDWLRVLMFLRTSDACPELGTKPNQYWTADNVRNCLSGAGVPIDTSSTTMLPRDVAMQQLFALRRHDFAFTQLATEPAGYVAPTDLSSVPANMQGAMVAADRLELLSTTNNQILPNAPLLREDAAFAVTSFENWEQQGGVDTETDAQQTLNQDATMDHWRDLDTDIYVIQVKMGGDSEIKPILPRREFNPSPNATTTQRDEYVYEKVSDLAQDTGALAAVNGSYFDVDWPWGALEDVAIIDGKMLLTRSDRSTFIVCTNGKMYVSEYDADKLRAEGCTPEQALGAGPMFMSGGNILTTSTNEGFDEYTEWERRVGSNARTAIAVSSDHKTGYIISVAGNSYPAFGRGGDSLGAFLQSKYPGMSDAMMFDGGDSSTLYAGGKVLVGAGAAGSQVQRAVVSAVGVFSKKQEAAAAAQFAKDAPKYWDKETVDVAMQAPTKSFAWQPVKSAKIKGETISTSGSRGASVKLVDASNKKETFSFTFDLIAYGATSTLTIARREGTDENGWHIPTEIHVLNPKDGSDTDIIKLLAYMPAAEQPDLKTFDAVAFGKTGIIFGDASGRYWYYYAKTKQFSPAKFTPPPPPPKPKVVAKKAVVPA
ncbi:MAG: phosphodiester glycosidase family protein, partial [Patescibacteria group bacterium]